MSGTEDLPSLSIWSNLPFRAAKRAWSTSPLASWSNGCYGLKKLAGKVKKVLAVEAITDILLGATHSGGLYLKV
jgi:hypothetical protein